MNAIAGRAGFLQSPTSMSWRDAALPLSCHDRDGAAVVSLRGEDFLFESGQDLSIGYLEHDREVVRFYLEESFSFHVATPEAAVPLQP